MFLVIIFSASNYMDFSVFIRIYYNGYGIQKITLKVWKVYICALTKNMEVSFSSSSASRKASSNESISSSVNCVTVSDTDVSVPARKNTELSTKLTRAS